MVQYCVCCWTSVPFVLHAFFSYGRGSVPIVRTILQIRAAPLKSHGGRETACSIVAGLAPAAE